MRNAKRIAAIAAAAAVALTGTTALAVTAGATPVSQVRHHRGFPAFVGPLHRVSTVASTVPGNGDVNPYGMAIVSRTTGDEFAGNILISNFNDKANAQGTGTTITEVTPSGRHWAFARLGRTLRGCPGGVGLTTALVALRSGWVIVGSLPTKGGNISGSGCLIVLDHWGHVRETIAGHGINGPWDMTAADYGHAAVLFVSNVLNGTVAAGGKTVNRGTVLRLVLLTSGSGTPRLVASTVIGSGFSERTDQAALVIGPTGLALTRTGVLYVADSVQSRIAVIPHALSRFSSGGSGFTVTQGRHLAGELGLALAPNGDILAVNADNGNLVEVTPSGSQIAVRQLDRSGSPPGAGALFQLLVRPDHRGIYFVDDATNTLNLLR